MPDENMEFAVKIYLLDRWALRVLLWYRDTGNWNKEKGACNAERPYEAVETLDWQAIRK